MNLPEEIIHYFLSFLEPQDVKNFADTCQSHRKIIRENYVFWKRYLQANYPEKYKDRPKITNYIYWMTKVKKNKTLDELQGWLFNVRMREYSHKKLESLQELNLSENKLSSLPESIGGLTSLQKLKCNKLTSLPESIGGLGSLQRLHIWADKLTIILHLPGVQIITSKI